MGPVGTPQSVRQMADTGSRMESDVGAVRVSRGKTQRDRFMTCCEWADGAWDKKDSERGLYGAGPPMWSRGTFRLVFTQTAEKLVAMPINKQADGRWWEGTRGR